LAKHTGDALSGFHSRHAGLDSKGVKGAVEQVFEILGLVSWELYFTRQAQKDAKKVASTDLRPHIERLLEILKIDPFQNPPPYEKLVGDLIGAYSRRINFQHRLVYQVLKDQRAVKIIRMWTHYE
jgi:Txe/YoeB family toxin of toxin-antitoxin system